MRRYAVFAGGDYDHTCQGMVAFKGSFDDVDTAITHAETLNYDWAEVHDFQAPDETDTEIWALGNWNGKREIHDRRNRFNA